MTHGFRLSLGLALALAAPAGAEGLRLRTELSYGTQLATATTPRRDTIQGSARLMWQGGAGPLDLELHAVLQAARPGAAAPAGPPASWLTLDRRFQLGGSTAARVVLDRASVTYSTEHLVLRAGRQAITWGGGLVFHPSDIVAPFAPGAIDTSYKPGVDMLYGQILFDSGADLQGVIVPRAAVAGGPLRLDASSFALRGAASFGDLDGALMLARDRGDLVAAGTLSGPLGDASWTAEYVHWRLANGESRPSWLLNISNFGRLGPWNVSYFAEAYHNGFGVGAGRALDSLPPSLSKRMSTGQVFVAGRDFLALGAQVQMTPDLSVSPSAILSLNDRSALAGLSVAYALGDNTDLSFDARLPMGAQGTEFGGRQLSAGTGRYAPAPRSLSLRLVRYF